MNNFIALIKPTDGSQEKIMFKVMEESRITPITNEYTIPILISDSLNLSNYKINLKKPEKIIHIANPENIYDFTIEISSTNKKTVEYFSIKGNYNWVTPKKIIRDNKDPLPNLPFLPVKAGIMDTIK